MFLSLFSSKNQKLVKKWMHEHEQIVVLAHKVISEYLKHDYDAAKKELEALNTLAVNHVMDEDIEFFRLLREDEKLDSETKKLVEEFVKSFKGVKVTLLNFLTKYTQPEATLDEEFFNTFNEIVSVLTKRIAFEEKNLYARLNSK